jgi:hypothetical protein
MKRSVIAFTTVFVLSLLLFLSLGCSASKAKVGDGDKDTTSNNEDAALADYQQGLVDGTSNGYQQGYTDGKGGVYAPQPEISSGNSGDYTDGYVEGFNKGYETGYSDAQAANKGGNAQSDEKEKTAVESAMLAFVKQNAVPGLEFKIENLVIHGDEAAGIAVCTSEKLDNALLIMKKGPNGWYGVDFGTGIEPPSWYQY